MELFDLVDKNDNVIGTTDNKTAHANGDIHRIVAVFLFDQDGNLYIQERLDSKGVLDHSVGGHVRKGESYDEAVKREAQEELGITTHLKKVSVFYSDETWGGSNVRHYIGLYECIAPKDWKFIANDEVKNVFPMTMKEIVDNANSDPKTLTGGFKNTLYEYIKTKGLPYSLKNYNL